MASCARPDSKYLFTGPRGCPRKWTAGTYEGRSQFNTRGAPPNTRWHYASVETEILGLVLRSATATYQVWLLPGEQRRFALLGIRGQIILVDPASKLVMVHTAVRPTPSEPGALREPLALWFAVLRQLGKMIIRVSPRCRRGETLLEEQLAQIRKSVACRFAALTPSSVMESFADS